MSPPPPPPPRDDTNRFVLRLAILFELYRAEHDGRDNHTRIAWSVVSKMGVPEHEGAAAMRYLIESRLVEGDIVNHGPSPDPLISRINNYGVDFIEKSLCTATFDSVRGDLEDGESIEDCAGKRRVFERILPEVTGAGMARYADLIMELSNIACGLIPGFVDLAS